MNSNGANQGPSRQSAARRTSSQPSLDGGPASYGGSPRTQRLQEDWPNACGEGLTPEEQENLLREIEFERLCEHAQREAHLQEALQDATLAELERSQPLQDYLRDEQAREAQEAASARQMAEQDASLYADEQYRLDQEIQQDLAEWAQDTDEDCSYSDRNEEPADKRRY